jgi:hypothetical protein
MQVPPPDLFERARTIDSLWTQPRANAATCYAYGVAVGNVLRELVDSDGALPSARVRVVVLTALLRAARYQAELESERTEI